MEFGLSEKEAKVYLALLELGMAPVQTIAQTAEINRSSTYVILERLIKQGFVSLAQDDNIQQYLAASPEIFLRLAEKRADKETDLRDRIKNLIPELKGLHKETKKKPKVRVFEGKEGLATAMMETLQGNKEKIVRASTSGNDLLALVHEEWKGWSEERMKRGVLLRAINVDNEAAKTIARSNQKFYQVVFVKPKQHPLAVDMMIAGDKVGYYLRKGNQGVTTIVIESPEVSAAMKSMFDITFEDAKAKGGRYLTDE